jgi:hypothetical protein
MASLGDIFRRGQSVFLPGSSGAPGRLAEAAFAAPGFEITTSFIPGVNAIPALAEGARCTGFFMQPGMGPGQRARQFRHLPLSYATTLKYFDEIPPFETCLVQMTPPDRAGLCSLGPAAEFIPAVMRRARRVVTLVPRLFSSLALARADGRYARILRQIAKTDLLILDDWGPETLTAEQRRDLLEIIDDRHEMRSVIITSQVPVERWYEIIGDPTMADAILDRLVHNAYRIDLKGESLRKKRTPAAADT